MPVRRKDAGGFPPPRYAQPVSPPSPSPEKTWTLSKGQVSLAVGILRISLLAGIGLIAWLNIKPYIGAVDALLFGDGQSPIMLALKSLPVVGWLVRGVQGFWSSLWGILLWAGFQVAEVMPVLLKNSESMKQLIYGIGNHRRLSPRPNATTTELMLIRQYNDKPQRWLQNAKWFATGAYVLDCVITFVHYPPIQGGFDGLRLWLAAPDFGAIDYRNLALMLITLFAFEGAIKVAMWMWEARELGIVSETVEPIR